MTREENPAISPSDDAEPSLSSSSLSSLTCLQTFALPAKVLGKGENALLYPQPQTAWHCTFSRDGQYLAACFGAPDPCIRVWKRKQQQQQQNQPKVTSSTTEQAPVDENDNDDEKEWFLFDEVPFILGGIHERTVRCIAFAPISNPLTLASASFDGTLSVWEKKNTNNNNTSDVWNCVAQLEGHDNEVKSVAWNSTGTLLASAGRDKTVWIWEAFLPGTVGGGSGDYECLAVLTGHEGDVKSVLFVSQASSSSKTQFGDGDEVLLSASYDDTIKCWAEDAGEWYCAYTISGVHSNTIWSLTALSLGTDNNSLLFVSAGADGMLAIYKADTNPQSREAEWKCVGTLPGVPLDDESGVLYAVHASPAAAPTASSSTTSSSHGSAGGLVRIATGGSDRSIQIFRHVPSSTPLDKPLLERDVVVPAAHAGDVNCVCWHPTTLASSSSSSTTCLLLASAGDDGTIRLWKYKTNNKTISTNR